MIKACPCNPSANFSDCCEPFLLGHQIASRAETLMRSRYSAFATQNLKYIRDTLDDQALSDYDEAANRAWASSATFINLEIIKVEELSNKANIEFVATYEVDGQTYKHHELSKFRKKGDRWYFREGRVRSDS